MSAVGPVAAAGAVSLAAAFLPPFFAGAAAPSSSVHTACPTLTLSPSATRMSFTTPAAGALTSMVTLSVSICAMTSSTATESPGALRTAAMDPSVMLSPIGGTSTCVARCVAAEWKPAESTLNLSSNNAAGAAAPRESRTTRVHPGVVAAVARRIAGTWYARVMPACSFGESGDVKSVTGAESGRRSRRKGHPSIQSWGFSENIALGETKGRGVFTHPGRGCVQEARQAPRGSRADRHDSMCLFSVLRRLTRDRTTVHLMRQIFCSNTFQLFTGRPVAAPGRTSASYALGSVVGARREAGWRPTPASRRRSSPAMRSARSRPARCVHLQEFPHRTAPIAPAARAHQT